MIIIRLIGGKITAFLAILQIKVILCYIFLQKNLVLSVIFCNFAAEFKNPVGLWKKKTLILLLYATI